MNGYDPQARVSLPSNKFELKGDLSPEFEYAEAKKLPRKFRGELETARALRADDLLVWDYGLAFVRGDQSFVTDRFAVDQRRFNELREKSIGVYNQLLPVYRATQAMMRSQFPGIQAQSMFPGYESELQSLATNNAVKSLWVTNRMEYQQNQMNMWLSPCGNAAWHCYPDTQPGKERLCIELVNPYNILFEPYVTRPEEARWSAVRKFVRREEAVKLFPQAKDVLKQQPAFSTDADQEEARIQQPTDRLELFWVYFVDGRCGVWSSDQWVYESTFPEEARPVTLVRYTVLPNRLHGLSQMMPLLLPQFRFNQMNELLFEIMKVTSSPHWLVPRQAQVDKNQLRNEPGNVVEYNDSASPPVQVPGPQAPPTLWDYLATARAAIEDGAGVHAASTGRRVPNVGSAVGMQTLIDQDQAQLDMTMVEIERGLCEAFRSALILWKAYMPGKMLVRVPGAAQGTIVTKVVETQDLSEQPVVEIRAGSTFSMSKERKDAFVMQLVQNGLPIQEALPHLSVQLDDKAAETRLQSLYYAKGVLEQMLTGATVDAIVPEPAFMEAVEQVFGEFVRSPDFYQTRADLEQQAAKEMQVLQQAAAAGVDQGQLDAQATDELQALHNVFTFYQQVVMFRAQMIAGGQPAAPPQPKSGSAPNNRQGPAPGVADQSNLSQKSNQAGPADKSRAEGPVNGPTSNEGTTFSSPGMRGAP